MDPVSNFLNTLKLAGRTGKKTFEFPGSRFIAEIAAALEKYGYVGSAARKGKRGRLIEVELAYDGATPKIRGLKRVSRLSKRVYLKAKDLYPVRSGFGAWILSTPKGVLSDKEARALRVGGEVLFEIW